MKRSSNLDIASLQVLYKSYKAFLLPVGMAVVSICLLFFFVLPQVNEIFSQRDVAAQTAQRVSILQNSIQLLSGIDDSALSQQLNLATSALPSGKDFIGILSAITYASQQAGVSIHDYSFQVGTVTGTVPSPSSQNAQLTHGPNIEFSVIVDGQLSNAQRFMHALSTTLPLSAATSIQGGGNDGSTVKLTFSFQPFAKNTSSDPAQKLIYMDSQDKKIMAILQQWKKTNPDTGNNLFSTF